MDNSNKKAINPLVIFFDMISKNHQNSTITTIIGPSIKFEGELKSQEDIFIKGVVLGNINTTKDVTIEQSAKIKGSIKARSVIIMGRVRGTIKAEEKLEIRETGRVFGDVDAKILAVTLGAVLQGRYKIGQEQDKIEQPPMVVVNKD